jgi:hypothetical protein
LVIGHGSFSNLVIRSFGHRSFGRQQGPNLGRQQGPNLGRQQGPNLTGRQPGPNLEADWPKSGYRIPILKNRARTHNRYPGFVEKIMNKTEKTENGKGKTKIKATRKREKGTKHEKKHETLQHLKLIKMKIS